MKKFLFAILLLSLFHINQSKAQDSRFSQFNQNPLHLNPAMTGLYNGALRVSLNYRTLFYSVLNEDEYTVYSASIENRFKIGESYASIGAMILQDEFGASGYKRSYYNFSGAYHQRLSEGNGYTAPDMFLVAGGQVGMGQYAFDPSALWFSSQYDNSLLEINRALDSGESFQEGGTNRFVDFNAGVLFFLSYLEGGSFYIGGAMHHISNPQVGLLIDSEETLYRRITVHSGGEIPIGDFTLMPSGVYRKQGPTESLTLGSSLRLEVNEEKALNLRAGAWLHVTKNFDDSYQLESAVVSSTFEYRGWQVGLSYDITLSTLRRSNFSRGAFELSLIKTTAEQYRSRVRCPEL